MGKVNIIDFNDWFTYDGFAEGSGRSEKIWLQSMDGEIGLFKFPKIDPETTDVTTEHISEHLAHQIGNILGVETARVDIGTYQGRIGCMSYLLNKANECIVEGAIFILGNHPDYDMERMQEITTGRYYCIDHLLEVSNSPTVTKKWIQMMLFDFIIGNSDRHQNNWAIVIRYAGKSLRGMVCPLYDNGSSLCCYVNERQIENYLGKDTNRFNALTDTKSRSMIRIDGFSKKHPTHVEVVTQLMKMYPETYDISQKFVSNLNPDTIDELMKGYVEILSDSKIKLISRYLKRKVEILEELINGGNYERT